MTACHLHDLQQSIFLNRDENAFRELYDHFYAPLYSFAKALTGSGVLAQEVTQDVFVKIWQHRHKLDEVKNLKTYLFVIARNVSLDYRKDKRQFFRTEEVSDIVLRFSDKVKTPEQHLLSKEILQHVNNAIEALPPRNQQEALAARTNGTVDPRLYVNALQPWVDSASPDGVTWRPIARYANIPSNIRSYYGWSFRKYNTFDNNIYNYNSEDDADIYILRLADVFLLYAEACKNTSDKRKTVTTNCHIP
jgi:RNA polymerase sigma factor (sigma-70 family)